MTSSQTLRDTDNFLSSISKKKRGLPSSIEVIYFILAREFGITLKDLEELPLPYVIGLLKTHNYTKEQEEKEAKKSYKKK